MRNPSKKNIRVVIRKHVFHYVAQKAIEVKGVSIRRISQFTGVYIAFHICHLGDAWSDCEKSGREAVWTLLALSASFLNTVMPNSVEYDSHAWLTVINVIPLRVTDGNHCRC